MRGSLIKFLRSHALNLNSVL